MAVTVRDVAAEAGVSFQLVAAVLGGKKYAHASEATGKKIREAARKSGMRTLREDGLRKAAAGTTTLEEVLATTIGDAD